MKPTDVRIADVSFAYEDHRYRTPIKFGGVALDRVTVLNVELTVESRGGKVTHGFGSMPLGNVWAWPSTDLGYDQTLAGMKVIATACRTIYAADNTYGHPVEIGVRCEHALGSAVNLAVPHLKVPPLAVLVVNSAFDAAVHDAFGKSLGLNCYRTYGPEFLAPDLGVFLGREFAGETLDRYVLAEPKPRMPLYHLVGALDPLTEANVGTPVGDGLPETLGEWIARGGLTHLKIKLNGDDLAWDVARVVGVDAVAADVQGKRGVGTWYYSLDFNEKCANVGYLIEFLTRVREQIPAGYDRVQYIEQPTKRDLTADRANVMHEAAKLRPVVIDESLLDLVSLHAAVDMGYTGVAFKACKGQTQTLLLAAAAQKMGLFRCVQDLTCPGASLVHSAGLAAHIPGVAAIESNSRQYCPAANAAWDAKFPGVFTIRDGTMNTGILHGSGLGAV
jgi:L-alanine-DL-glutamate epimerase-like enolase superfamily enzyme